MIRNSFLVIMLIALILLASGCFQIIKQENINSPLNLNQDSTFSGQNGYLQVLHGANSGDQFGASIAYFSDVDGEGNPGIAVGAMSASPSNKKEAGSVYVISLKNSQALYRLDGQQAGDLFGRTIATVGDLNGDKIPEFIVGAPSGDVGGFVNAGYVGLYSGKDGERLDYYVGIAYNFGFGHSLTGLEDLNGDTIPEFAIGAPSASYDGQSNTGIVIVELSQKNSLNRQAFTLHGEATGDKFGWTIADISDVDGDRIADIAVGAPGVKTSSGVNVGRIYVLSGKNCTVLYKIDGKNSIERFGFSIAGIEDINGDEIKDFIVGAPSVDLSDRLPPLVYNSDDSSTGKVYVLSGKDGSTIMTLEGSSPGFLFGFSVASGNIDGDGVPDIVVSDPSALQNDGSVHIFSGRDGKSLYTFTNNPDMKDRIGSALISRYDLNDDGRADIIVGANNSPSIEGKPTGVVYILTAR